MAPDPPRVVVLTGAAGGIGRATAEALAAAGASLALLDVSQAVEEQAEDFPNARGYPVDVTDRDRLREVFAAVERDLGPPAVLINNAAVMALSPFEELTPEVARRVLEVNLLAPLHAMQLVVPGMLARGHGQIVNVSSAAARWGIPGENVYVAAKWGLDGLGEVVRRELAPRGVSLTTVYMGPVGGTELSLGMKRNRLVRFSERSDVADAIVEAVRRPRPEVWVPRQLRWAVRMTELMPRRWRERLQELAGVTRVATEVDWAARAAYEERVFGASPGRAAGRIRAAPQEPPAPHRPVRPEAQSANARRGA